MCAFVGASNSTDWTKRNDGKGEQCRPKCSTEEQLQENGIQEKERVYDR